MDRIDCCVSFQIAFELCFYKGSLDAALLKSNLWTSFPLWIFPFRFAYLKHDKKIPTSDCKIFLIKSVSIWLQISKRHSVLIGKYNTGASKLASMHLTYESITFCSSARSIITSIYLSISITLGSIYIVCMGFNLFAFCWYPYRRIIIWEECVQGQ